MILMPCDVSPFCSLESLVDNATSVVKGALLGNKNSLNDGAYLLWNGVRFVGDPIIPETLEELPFHESAFWSSETDMIRHRVHTLGLAGFAYAFRAQDKNCWYVMCFNSTSRDIFTALKLYYDVDRAEFRTTPLNDVDWTFLRMHYFVDGALCACPGSESDRV